MKPTKRKRQFLPLAPLVLLSTWIVFDLWFCHPGIDQFSFARVTLFDIGWQPLAQTSSSTAPSAANSSTENLGWIAYTASPGSRDEMPESINVRLE